MLTSKKAKPDVLHFVHALLRPIGNFQLSGRQNTRTMHVYQEQFKAQTENNNEKLDCN